MRIVLIAARGIPSAMTEYMAKDKEDRNKFSTNLMVNFPQKHKLLEPELSYKVQGAFFEVYNKYKILIKKLFIRKY